MTENDDLIQIIAGRKPGTVATLQIVRGGRTMNVPVKLAERPLRAENVDAAADEQPPPRRRELPWAWRSAISMTSCSGISTSRRACTAWWSPGRSRRRCVRGRHPARARPHGNQPSAGAPVGDFQRLVAAAKSGDVLTLYIFNPGSGRAPHPQDRLIVKPRILVIDDEGAIRDSLRMILEYEDYQFVGAATGQEGIAAVQRERPDLVLLDIKMPGMDGLEVLRKLHALDETLPVVMISGHGTTATAVEAIRSGAVDFLDKPLSSERVIVTLQNALKQSELRSENRELKLAMESKCEIVGQSASLRVLEAVQRAAPTNATVMLLGESGVGKELVARTVHRNSPRAGQRFVQVNCAAIPEELIESELFGHEKGSFTGATRSRSASSSRPIAARSFSTKSAT